MVIIPRDIFRVNKGLFINDIMQLEGRGQGILYLENCKILAFFISESLQCVKFFQFFEKLHGLIYEQFLSIPLFYFFILFDKYGEDSMKRSLYNYLTSQMSYPVIIQGIFYTPITAWRVYIGPLNSIAADFNILILNSTLIWCLLCQSEAVLIRAILLSNYKYICCIDDKFFSSLLFMLNFGFSFGSHFGLFFLGSLGSDKLLTGVQRKMRPTSLFYVFTIGAIFVITGKIT